MNYDKYVNLLKLETSESIYKEKGLKYFNGKLVMNVRPTPYKMNDFIAFEAAVVGNSIYEPMVLVRGTGVESYCKCSPIHHSDKYNHCEHAVALMFEAIEYIKSTQDVKTNSELNSHDLEHLRKIYSSDSQLPKNRLNWDFDLKIERYSNNEFDILIGARAGTDKMYVVRDLKEALLTYKGYQENCLLTSKLEYNNKEFLIPDVDIVILDFMFELIPFHYNLNLNRFRYLNVPYNKLFVLYDLLMQKDESYKLDYFQLVKGEPNAMINVVDEVDKYLLTVSGRNKLIILDRESGVVYENGIIYQVDEKYQKYLIPLIEIIKSKKNQLYIDKDKNNYLINDILPYIMFNKPESLNIEEEIKEKMIVSELNTNIYIDKFGKNVSLKIVFDYGITKEDDKQFIIKDVVNEEKVFKTLKDLRLKKMSDLYMIDNIEDIFKLSEEVIPKLQDLDNVNLYHSEDFKNMLKGRSFGYSIRAGFESDLLAIEMDYDNIDRSELVNILKNIKNKKKYYQLKSGDIIKIDNEAANEWSLIVDGLSISSKDITSDKILMDKYEALYLDEIFNEIGEIKFEYDEELKYLLDNIKSSELMDFKVPTNLNAKLRDYQVRGYKWLKTLKYYGFGGILADDMGLGKTIQVITLILDSVNNKSESQSLVVAPSSVIYNWEEELKKFAPSLSYLVLADDKVIREKHFENLDKYDVIITSYALLRRDIDNYLDYEFEYCFLDEAQYIKNNFSASAQAAKQIKANGKFALTGTPIENSLSELWSIFDFIMPGYLRSHNHFKKNYESLIIKDNDKVALEKLNKKVLPFILRRKKEVVALELPEKQESNVYITLNKDQEKVYMAYLLQAKKEIDIELAENGFNKSQIKILSILTRLRQICCDPRLFMDNYEGESSKYDYLFELIKERLKNNHRILIFSQFTSMLDMIESNLNKKSYFRIDGSVKTKERMDMVKRFNMGEKEIFLISLKAGGTGLNLTGADTVIHYDPWWNPAVEDQATDRAYRIGQDKKVEVFKLITKHTIEEKINELKDKKRAIADSVIQDGETFINKLSENDLNDIFNYDN